jgi:outer membrane receptor for ferrienterochelin and colicins
MPSPPCRRPALLLSLLPIAAWAQTQQTAPAGAADESILFQEIPSVYGASKYRQKVSEAPSSVTIVTAADIEHYGYRTLADILRAARTFYVTYDRNYNYVGVRGFGPPGDYNSRVLLLVDGHRVNDNIYASASIGTEGVIEVDLIDRVEIIRGPASSLYGTGAFFGVINVISKRGREIDGVQVSAEAGSLETYKARASAGKKLSNGAELLVSASGYHSAGQKELFFPDFDDPATSNGVAHGLDADQYANFFGALSFEDFSLKAGSVTRIKTIPTASFGSVFDHVGTNTTDTRQYVDVRYQHNFDSGSNVSARLYYDRYHYQGNYLSDPALDATNVDLADDQWWGTELQYGFTLAQRHRITLGGEYIDDFRQDLRNFDTNPFQTNVDSNVSARSVGLYAQDEYRILDSLILNLGIRHDELYEQGSSTNPRIAAIWLPRAGTAIKLLYGSAFRAPNGYERYWGGFSPSVNALNPSLQPEEIKTTEAVWEQELAQGWRSTLGAYRYRIDNLISLIPDPAGAQFVFVNAAPIVARGVAFEIEYRAPEGLEARASYSYQDSEVEATGAALPNSPHDLLKLNFAAPIWRQRLTAGLEVQYMGSRLTLAGEPVTAYAITNVTLTTRRWWPRLDLSASVYNLFDRRYFDPGTGNMEQQRIEQDGRVFRLKLTYTF